MARSTPIARFTSVIVFTWTVVLAVASGSAFAQGYELIWEDDFGGTQVDPQKWEFQIGTGCPDLCGWGNNELQYYRAENATVSGGFLTIRAKQESFGGRDYTSARLRTRNRGDWTYGRIEMRAKMPIGRGLWSAFWMLPTDEVYGTWAASGEIDILEHIGQDPARALGTLHYGGTWPNNASWGDDYVLPSGNFHESFHDFALEWTPCEIRWYVDGLLFAVQDDWYSAGGPYPAPFDQRFHLLLNLAVGGNLPGPPDHTTQFPQDLVVDWVRVYRAVPDIYPCRLEFDDMDHGDPFGNGWFVFNGSVGGGGIDPNFFDLPPVDGCRASLQSGWGSGGVPGFFGGFGRTNQLDLTEATHFTFWIHPDAGQDYTLELNLQDDDNGDDQVPSSPDGADDEFQYDFRVSPTGPGAISGGGWQFASVPLADFFDDGSFHFGGNGVLDPIAVTNGGNGRLVNVVFAVIGESGSDATFRTDRWAFTRQTGSVQGLIWGDLDGDGVLDEGEPPLVGVAVSIVDINNGWTAAEATGSQGTYAFLDLAAGSYEVRVDPGTLPAGYEPSFDPDGILSAHVFSLPVECDEAILGGDFGYAPETTSVDPPADGSAGGELRSLLGPNTPNPFSPRTAISFQVRTAGPVELSVFDVAGREVCVLLAEPLAVGRHEVVWDGRDAAGRQVPDGTYFYRLRSGGGEFTRRMTVLR